jgi:hypothetical protein
MNEYLAKLHSLESVAKGLGRERPLVRSRPKPTEPSFGSFGGDLSMGISGPGLGRESGEAVIAMQTSITRAPKNASYGHCQNRQNLPLSPFSKVYAALVSRSPEYVEQARWQQCVDDAQRFLAMWGEQAQALGWNSRDLFGLHTVPTNPHPSYSRLSRYDTTGLIWLLQGQPVIALTTTTAAIKKRTTGNVLTYRRYNKPAFGPVGDSLDDFTAL